MMLEVHGMQLHYDLHGEGEPLLWLHGEMGHGPDWRFIFKEPPAGYRLIAPDLRGHGRSTGASKTYSFKQSALDMFALLDHQQVDRIKVIGPLYGSLREFCTRFSPDSEPYSGPRRAERAKASNAQPAKGGISRAQPWAQPLAGLSGGGITSLHMATIQPPRVTAMVVVSAPAAFPEQARAIQRIYSGAMLSDAERTRMRQRHQRPGQLDTLFTQVHAMADGDDPNFTPEQLATITAETLIVFGDRDPLYPVSLAVELKQAIPRSWLWVVPNGGHGPVFGQAAPLFVDTALAFLGGAYHDVPAPLRTER